MNNGIPSAEPLSSRDRRVTLIPPKEKSATKKNAAGRKLRVAAYARVSTDRDEQFTSYASQIRYYTDKIAADPAWRMVKIYTDEGISGTRVAPRKGFCEMISDALAGKIDLILTKSVSRFARNTVDSLTAIRELSAAGVEVWFEKENIRTLDAGGELLLTVMSSLAQEESRSISQNVSFGIRERARQGKTQVPFSRFLGYKKAGDGLFAVRESDRATVVSLFAWRILGLSAGEIASLLTSEKIATPGGGKKWYSSTVASILSNEKYKGDCRIGKTHRVDYLTKRTVRNTGEYLSVYVKDNHEAIIPPRVWDEVNAGEAKIEGPERRLACDLLSGTVLCGRCGGLYGPKTWHPRTASEKRVWICNGKNAPGLPPCEKHGVSEDELLDACKKAIEEIGGWDRVIGEITAEMPESIRQFLLPFLKTFHTETPREVRRSALAAFTAVTVTHSPSGPTTVLFTFRHSKTTATISL